jgi:anti-sigma-K factor RskA
MNKMDQDRFKELCFQYFLNQIQAEDYDEFKNALESEDEKLNKIFLDIKKIVLHLPLTSEMVEPSPSVKRKILNSIKNDGVEETKGSIEKLAGYLFLKRPKLAFALTAILIIAIGFLVVLVFNLNKTINTQQSQITLLENEVEKNEQLLSVLTSKEIEVVIMNGLEINPSGYGKIIWDPERKSAILQISNLPPESEDKDYQLWVIKENKPISAGTFSTNQKEENFFKIENLAEVNKNLINAFAVTLEPKGGVPQPTGEMYLLGKPTLQ